MDLMFVCTFGFFHYIFFSESRGSEGEIQQKSTLMHYENNLIGIRDLVFCFELADNPN